MNTDQNPFENCPLGTFSCITTTDTAPYRIVDLEVEALDLFLSGSSSELDLIHDHNCSLEQQIENQEKQARARERALRFLTGLNMTDVFIPDRHSCLSPAAAAVFSPSEDCNMQSFIISEDAILPSTADCTSFKPTTPRRIHACVHQSVRFHDHHTHGNGYRYYLVKDVTEMHALALAAKNGIRASGRLGQRQQPLSTRRDRAQEARRKNRRIVRRTSPSDESEEKLGGTLSHRDSGISLDDHTWGSAPSSLSTPEVVDPGLLILQVTRFGTIDHAFAIPQSDRNDKFHAHSHHNTRLFLAQDKTAIEAMASNSLMAYVHPQDLPSLCKGLDQVCKGQYTIFRARWRIEGLQEYSDDEDSDDEIDRRVGKAKKTVAQGAFDMESRIIKYEGELYEEWVDPSASASLAMSAMGKAEEFAWTEVTGVLSQGNPILVVRPLTMPEVEELEAPSATAVLSKTHHADSQCAAEKDEDDEGYLEMDHDCESEESSDSEMTAAKQNAHRKHARKQSNSSEDVPAQTVPELQSTQDSTSVARRSSECQCRRRDQRDVRPPRISWPPVSAVAVEAWNQWIDTLNLTKEQFAAWREYLLEAFLNQTISTVSRGISFLGCDSLVIAQPFPYDGSEFMTEFIKYQEQKRIQNLKEQSAPSNKAVPSPKLPGLNRAGKVLEAQYPALDGVVRQIGGSWIGQRIIETGRLDEKLDMVAGHAMDLWESEDRVATLTNAVPLLNTLTTYASYTPISFFASKIRK